MATAARIPVCEDNAFVDLLVVNAGSMTCRALRGGERRRLAERSFFCGERRKHHRHNDFLVIPDEEPLSVCRLRYAIAACHASNREQKQK